MLGGQCDWDRKTRGNYRTELKIRRTLHEQMA